jgi:putative PIN family toxin of toxin-antitoxin system
MPTEDLYVFDANCIVSAVLLPGSIPRQAFDKACSQGTVLLSSPVINELDDVLRRPRLEKYVHEEERIHFLVALVREASVIDVSLSVAECRDPKDNKHLELAVTGSATCVVSGDQDLLVLNPYRGIPILTPRQFLEQTDLR